MPWQNIYKFSIFYGGSSGGTFTWYIMEACNQLKAYVGIVATIIYMGTKLALLRNEMHRFMESLQGYLLFEVLETSWEGLRESMNEATDLDEVIRAHEEYQKRMIKVALLGPDLKALRKGLHDVMDIVMAFCGEHERILTSALEIIHRRNMYEQNVKARLDEGQWG